MPHIRPNKMSNRGIWNTGERINAISNFIDEDTAGLVMEFMPTQAEIKVEQMEERLIAIEQEQIALPVFGTSEWQVLRKERARIIKRLTKLKPKTIKLRKRLNE